MTKNFRSSVIPFGITLGLPALLHIAISMRSMHLMMQQMEQQQQKVRSSSSNHRAMRSSSQQRGKLT